MKIPRQNHGKISAHFTGLGTVTRDTVVERAREIALINGRGPNHYTQEDFLQAKRELTGTLAEDEGEWEEEVVPGLVTWDEPPDAAGRSADKERLDDDLNCAALLVEEGIDEAEHDLMVEGARNSHNQE
jgi:hypothetical protein